MVVPPEESQALESLVHARQGGVERAVQGLGDLAELLALVDALADDLALRRGQLVEQLTQPAGVVLAFGLHQRSGQRIEWPLERSLAVCGGAACPGLPCGIAPIEQ